MQTQQWENGLVIGMELSTTSEAPRSISKAPHGDAQGSTTEGVYHTNRVDIRAAARDAANLDAYFGYIGFRYARGWRGLAQRRGSSIDNSL